MLRRDGHRRWTLERSLSSANASCNPPARYTRDGSPEDTPTRRMRTAQNGLRNGWLLAGSGTFGIPAYRMRTRTGIPAVARFGGQAGDEFDGVLPFDTDLVFVIGRTQLLGADDVPVLSKVMAGYRVQTLSAYRGQSAPALPPVQWLIWNDEASRDEHFIGTLNFLLSFCQPIHRSEGDLMARFAQIGIGAWPGLRCRCSER